ncbi:Phosphoribosylglycinamide formyltransferase 2 [Raoultella planticola]|uniref:Phosphoribosylglycinamide formyltransferase 2 n=1 Tax=Raoultella planticola TaxID=575 RepID=A0A485AQB2_RAOPL|nr:Phosphoribosylglycinamide formyltransferase 2 [Raoultella planticola]
MQVAHRSHVINMLHGETLRALIAEEKPDFIVPEIEAIATDMLVELEQAGQKVVPTARAAKLTMNREGYSPPGRRGAAASHLGIPLCRQRSGLSRSRRGDWPSLHCEAGHELFW